MRDESGTSPPDERKPFEKFADLAKRIAHVPKKEVERREAGYRKKRARRKGSS
ncbi:MAG: hypothetical protein ACRDHD_01525 [Candidatus Limnocylindria bacterium]